MSKEKNLSFNEVAKKHSSDYFSITKLIAHGRPDPTNPDWVAIQEAAKKGEISRVDDLLSSPETNYAAKKLANAEIFSLLSSQERPYLSPSDSKLYLLAGEGYIKTLNCIIDSQIKQITDLQKKIDDIPKLKKIMKPEAQIELTQREKALNEQLNDWQSCLEINIDNLLTIGVNRGNSNLIALICDKFQDKLNLDKFNPCFPIENTLLATAAKLNHFPVVKTLLGYKANPNVGDSKTAMALIHAILNGNIKMAKLLIKKGANLNLVAIHRGTKVDENGNLKFFEEEINVDDAIKLAPNSEDMASCINEIKSRGEFFTKEMIENGPHSPILSGLGDPDKWPEIIEEGILGQNIISEIKEQ